ncbi:uncharacterized protein A4U43_C09F3240 [Asparagus officinalis]|uniref:Uncharacterized protein n=1 Tax=Asparagus officinalis TaxID=4686 RepID=A0A5P1E888_ASPOF|nr:uncharacterized protein A4U43_C09F3240 [Asparagus officinalis]
MSTFCYFFIAIFVRVSIRVLSAPQVPAMFIVDSLVDNGNNNNSIASAKANFHPYGIDIFQGPTGRFCNGKAVVNAPSDLLGLPYLPPYTSPFLNGTALLAGVNYASAAGGILDESGQFLAQRYSLRQQVLNFQDNLNQLRSLMSAKNVTQYLARSIAMFVIGSNDYINNYLLPPLYLTRFNYNPQQYANLLLNHYTRQLLALYSLGLPEFFLTGIGPLGCIPNQQAMGLAPPYRCIDQVNQMLGPFNVGLKTLVQQLNKYHTGAIFAYGNTYGALDEIINNPKTFGFTVIDQGCCGLGRNRGQITCLPFAIPCRDRNQHVSGTHSIQHKL